MIKSKKYNKRSSKSYRKSSRRVKRTRKYNQNGGGYSRVSNRRVAAEASSWARKALQEDRQQQGYYIPSRPKPSSISIRPNRPNRSNRSNRSRQRW